jgi:uncharacterized protein YlxP (DUF503 family)
MIVGVLTLDLRLHGNHSLKGKRKVAQSLKQRLRNTFNVAVSEVEALDVHDRLVLGVATLANETAKVESRLSKAIELVEAMALAELVDCRTEIFSAEGAEERP